MLRVRRPVMITPLMSSLINECTHYLGAMSTGVNKLSSISDLHHTGAHRYQYPGERIAAWLLSSLKPIATQLLQQQKADHSVCVRRHRSPRGRSRSAAC